MKKNILLTFCFSMLPGAGQMYQGYMKRGLSIMILFAIFFGITVMISTPIFAIPIPIIFAYSFFDTFNIRNKGENDEEPTDEYIWDAFGFSELSNKFKHFENKKLIGTLLILVGIYLLLNSVLYEIAYRYDLYILEAIISVITRYLPTIIISLLSIEVGIKFLKK